MSTEFRIRFEDGEVVITRRSWRDGVDKKPEVDKKTGVDQKVETDKKTAATTAPATQQGLSVSLPDAFPGTPATVKKTDDKATGEPSPTNTGGGRGGTVCCGGGITVVFGSVNMCRCSAFASDDGSGEGDDPSSGGRTPN